jgi:ferredoxin-type protein NapH
MKRQNLRLMIVLASFLLFPITINYHSPVLIFMGAAQGIIVASFILFSAQFLSALFLGRAWCGWACAGAGLQDFCAFIRDKRARRGKLDWIKYLIWVPWLGAIVALSVASGGYRSVNPLIGMETGISVDAPEKYVIYYFFVGLIFLMALTAGKRAFCHYVCWMAPFMVIGTKIRNFFGWPALHLRADKESCVDCKLCDKRCPMSLDVSSMVREENMENSECVLCGSCVDACSKGSIRFAFWPRKRKVS